MQMKVPANEISVGTDASNGDRQLQFTHITWDAGTGPFEIDPTTTRQTGTASWVSGDLQEHSPGRWTLDHSVPLPAPGCSTRLRTTSSRSQVHTEQRQPDGSIGTVVATSPKKDYCITGDAFVGGRAERAEQHLHSAVQLHRPDQAPRLVGRLGRPV